MTADKTVDIQDLKIVGEGLDDNSIKIMTLDENTATARTFFWIPAEYADPDAYPGFELGKEGWFDFDNWEKAQGDFAKIFEEGEGFLLDNANGAEVTIVYAGEVVNGATLIPIGALSTIGGNMTPVALDIQRFVVEGEGLDDNSIKIMTLDENTATARTFFWIPADYADPDAYPGFELGKEGWFDFDNWEKAQGDFAKEFLAGEGFLLDNGNAAEASLKIPSPLE